MVLTGFLPKYQQVKKIRKIMFNSFSKFPEKNGPVKFHYMSISAIVKQNKQTKKFMYIKNNKKSIMYLKDTGSLTLKNKILWIV